MEKQITGTVNAVAQREGNYGILIGEVWFNGKGKSSHSKGNNVTINYKENEKNGKVFRNIVTIMYSDEPPKTQKEAYQKAKEGYKPDKDAMMARMSALKSITTILATDLQMTALDKVKTSESYAKKWSAWILTGKWE